MKFAEFVSEASIRTDLAASDKVGAIEELATALSESGNLGGDAVSDIVEAVMARERLGSTGIGRGVAVPHAKHEKVEKTRVWEIECSRGTAKITAEIQDGEWVYEYQSP